MTDRPRESDPTARPSDAVTAKVVAKWKGWGSCLRDEPLNNKFCEGGMLPPYGKRETFADPRDDTDAAMKLLGWLDTQDLIADVEIDYYWTETVDGIKGSCWEVELCENNPEMGMGEIEYVHLPLSGEPFRYAVVNLAARVWGVEG